MIHEILRLRRPLIVFDTETTGVNPDQDRIVELGYKKYTTADGCIESKRRLINPGVPIPAKATRAHGIHDEDVVEAPRFEQIARSVAETFSFCDFAGKNIRFDLRILKSAFDRTKVIEWSYDGAAVIDAERLEQILFPRTLSDLYKKYTGEELKDAHSALVDVEASVAVLANQLNMNGHIPRDIVKLHQLMWPDWVDSEGKIRFDEDGDPYITFGAHRGKSLRDVPSKYWQWIQTAGFSVSFKSIAFDALMGVYPKKATE